MFIKGTKVGPQREVECYLHSIAALISQAHGTSVFPVRMIIGLLVAVVTIPLLILYIFIDDLIDPLVQGSKSLIGKNLVM